MPHDSRSQPNLAEPLAGPLCPTNQQPQGHAACGSFHLHIHLCSPNSWGPNNPCGSQYFEHTTLSWQAKKNPGLHKSKIVNIGQNKFGFPWGFLLAHPWSLLTCQSSEHTEQAAGTGWCHAMSPGPCRCPAACSTGRALTRPFSTRPSDCHQKVIPFLSALLKY